MGRRVFEVFRGLFVLLDVRNSPGSGSVFSPGEHQDDKISLRLDDGPFGKYSTCGEMR